MIIRLVTYKKFWDLHVKGQSNNKIGAQEGDSTTPEHHLSNRLTDRTKEVAPSGRPNKIFKYTFYSYGA